MKFLESTVEQANQHRFFEDCNNIGHFSYLPEYHASYKTMIHLLLP